ncbi:peptidoglycan DD-metalloendopeptidase family protein [Gaetbulibacter sp. M235]|uniref:peptidoglycan DD-metalloendopeptidase family protein n=1 Tax=Gaetbulibacter sp. M235 TaxID=3126510 RepID=UPI00374ECD61
MNTFSGILELISKENHYVLDRNIPLSKYIPIDLSAENKLLLDIDVSSSDTLGRFINKQIKNENGLVGFGGYNETRRIYQRSTHFNEFDIGNERNIHLGIDLWCEAETPIYAPLDATVHSFKNNTNHGDYGPTIILKHSVNNITFYTLYGHLSLKSITNIKEGQVVYKGEKMAALGYASVNGDYPPHLHFQIIKDIQDYKGDYPGVCSLKNLEFYLNNCPDPNLLLKLKI